MEDVLRHCLHYKLSMIDVWTLVGIMGTNTCDLQIWTLLWMFYHGLSE